MTVEVFETTSQGLNNNGWYQPHVFDSSISSRKYFISLFLDFFASQKGQCIELTHFSGQP